MSPEHTGELAAAFERLAADLRAGTVSLETLCSAIGDALCTVEGSPPSSVEVILERDPVNLGQLRELLTDAGERARRAEALRLQPGPHLLDSDGSDSSVEMEILSDELHSASRESGTLSLPDEPDSSGTPASPASGQPLQPLLKRRYVLGCRLGVGGQGEVRQALDVSLQRTVALKILKEELAAKPAARHSFLAEASLTAQLSHPSIVPIYDVGELANGAPCYTMKKIRGRSLRDVLIAKRLGEPWAQDFTRRRLLDLLCQVANAVGYAHHRGVTHRDLKPGNIMAGRFGEILVVDWGIAKPTHDAPRDVSDGPVRGSKHKPTTRLGTVKGTPAYMAPEQALGKADRVGPWTDVHALGLILFETLTGRTARKLGDADEVLLRAREPVTTTPEELRVEEDLDVEPIPEELDLITMTCLKLEPQERYQDGEAVAKAIRAYLDGQRRRELAEQAALEAEALTREMDALVTKADGLRTELEAQLKQVEPWAPLEKKRPVWKLEEAVKQLDAEKEDVVRRSIAGYTRALDDHPANPRARAGLAKLYFEQLCHSEAMGRLRDAQHFEAQIRRFDTGELEMRLQALGSLALRTLPDRAEMWLYELESQDRRMVPVRGRKLGRSPIEVANLPVGQYLCVVRSRGGQELRYPILIRRQALWEGTITLRPALDHRYVVIPGGRFLFGGDRLAENSRPREAMVCPDFAIGRLPVTCREYLRFLRSMTLDEAVLHAPRTSRSSGGLICWPAKDGQIRIPRVDSFGGRWDPRYPVRSVSRDDATRYVMWRSNVDELELRLPTEIEWEKAARGVDGRPFPWGDAFDATFCKMRASRPGRPQPEPAGSFEFDVSIYGVRDVAGSISEWTSSRFDSFGLMGTLKGGHWGAEAAACRCARRVAWDPEEPAPFAGFRLLLQLATDNAE